MFCSNRPRGGENFLTVQGGKGEAEYPHIPQNWKGIQQEHGEKKGKNKEARNAGSFTKAADWLSY